MATHLFVIYKLKRSTLLYPPPPHPLPPTSTILTIMQMSDARGPESVRPISARSSSLWRRLSWNHCELIGLNDDGSGRRTPEMAQLPAGWNNLMQSGNAASNPARKFDSIWHISHLISIRLKATHNGIYRLFFFFSFFPPPTPSARIWICKWDAK